jgi:hypothetical protein
VASGAEGNQVQFRIIPQVAAELPVMHFQIRYSAARLTTPAITPQDLLPQIFLRCGI